MDRIEGDRVVEVQVGSGSEAVVSGHLVHRRLAFVVRVYFPDEVPMLFFRIAVSFGLNGSFLFLW